MGVGSGEGLVVF